MTAITEANLLSQLNEYAKLANQIRLKHNQEADLKLLADPVIDFDVILTPKLLQFGNIQTLLDMYAAGEVDAEADDLGLQQTLRASPSKKKTTKPLSSRLT